MGWLTDTVQMDAPRNGLLQQQNKKKALGTRLSLDAWLLSQPRVSREKQRNQYCPHV